MTKTAEYAFRLIRLSMLEYSSAMGFQLRQSLAQFTTVVGSCALLHVSEKKTAVRCTRNILNPRTDGGPGHLSTDGGGADNCPPRRSRKRSKLETRGKRHWIRTDKIYNFY